MAGWSEAKRDRVEAAFYAFLAKCFINSKDKGRICLGEHLYDGQMQFITAVFDALEADIHHIYCLKSRQLGISTIVRALIAFYVGIHDGLKGALIFDTSPHKESARKELVTLIKNLPRSLRFPEVQGTGSGNRESLTLMNESVILFMSAGVKESKSSGTLGRSEGLTVAHLSELCSYENPTGIKALEQSFSDEHPDRLYIYESTARGYNMWKTMWDKAKADPHHCKCLFLGWFSKPSQSIPQEHADFQLYGLAPPTTEEAVRIKAVRDQYGHVITPEQLAWIRKKVNPEVNAENDSAVEEDDTIMLAEQAWTEEEAWQQTGSVFFAGVDLTDMTNKHVSRKYKSFMFLAGEEFADMKIYRSENPRSTELKVWEEPTPEGVYVAGVDPAYGENENNCNSAIQILRCYADGVDQVAEYAWPLQTTRHLAWTLAAILGWYGASPRAVIRYILELNGPGTAVYNEIKSLKFYIENATYIQKPLEERGLMNLFQNVKTYIYTRPDSMGPGYNYHWLTNTRLKITIMEQLRDIASNGKLRIRSMDLIEEMRSISREGDSIGAPSSMRDDRAVAMALANYYWMTKIRQGLIGERRTRAAEESRQRLSIVDQVTLFNQNSLETFFAAKQAGRRRDAVVATRNAWRYGTGRRY
jgi:hypothetical protein